MAAALLLDSFQVSVGDSEVDVLTARNANLWSIGVTYGFAPHTLERKHPDILVDTPEELAQALTGTQS
jgi:phosphoglycolate phosphatase